MNKVLKELSTKASSIIQKNGEAAGTLKLIEEKLFEEGTIPENHETWALRNAIRTIESAIDDAAVISDTISDMKEMKNV